MPKNPIAEGRRAHLRAQRQPFNADERAEKREKTPVVISGVTFTRRRKDWRVSQLQRGIMRAQEKAVALSTRLRARIAELEVEQAEAAAEGNDEREEQLETQIDTLVKRGDEAIAAAELVSYRLLALLLIPPADESGTPTMRGFGPDAAEGDEDAVLEAIAFLQGDEERPGLDVEEVVALAEELTGSDEPDPPTTPSSGDSSS